MLGYFWSVQDSLWDHCLGVRTTDQFFPFDTSLHRDAHKSNALGYSLARYYIRLLQLQPSDVVYELGCGTGRPLCLFARQRIARCVGIELDPRAVEIAKRNSISVIGRQTEIAVVQGDAASADYRYGSVFFVCNPFGQRTLTTVLERIKESVEASPRAVRFCYVHPEHEQVFSACGWLSKYKTVQPRLHRSCAASFWRSVDGNLPPS